MSGAGDTGSGAQADPSAEDRAPDRPAARAGAVRRVRSWLRSRVPARLLPALAKRLPAPTPGRIAAAALAALAIGGGVLVAFLPSGEDGRSVEIALSDPMVFHPVAEFLTDLKPVGAEPTPYVRLTVVAQLPEADVSRLEQRQVEILAAVQDHLREQERASLIGRAGSERLRADIARIINERIAPAEVRAVLFTQFLLD
jgi:flagellar basal body-associated protein FliL